MPVAAEALVASDRRYGSNRHNPYLAPRALDELPFGLEAFDCANASNPVKPQPAPPCRVQAPFHDGGSGHSFPHLGRAP